MYLQQLRAGESRSEAGLLLQVHSKFGPSALVQKDIKACLLLCQGNIHHLLIRAPLCPLCTPPHHLEVRWNLYLLSQLLSSKSALVHITCTFTSAFHILVIDKTASSHNFIWVFQILSSSLLKIHPPKWWLPPPSSVGPPAVALCHFFNFVPILITALLLRLLLRLSLLRCLDLLDCISHTGALVCPLTGVCLLVIWGDNVWSQQKKMLDEHQKPEASMILKAQR